MLDVSTRIVFNVLSHELILSMEVITPLSIPDKFVGFMCNQVFKLLFVYFVIFFRTKTPVSVVVGEDRSPKRGVSSAYLNKSYNH